MESISSNGLGRKDEWDRPTPLRDSESDAGSSEYHTGTASFTPSYTPKTVLSSRILKQMGLVPIEDAVTEESSVAKGSDVFNRFLKLSSMFPSFFLHNHTYIHSNAVVRKTKSLIETSIFLKKALFGKQQKRSMFSLETRRNSKSARSRWPETEKRCISVVTLSYHVITILELIGC